MTKHVDILLSTYQGASYLQEQVHSILHQTYPHFHIWIRDDGSTDETRSILHTLAQRHSTHLSLIPSNQNLGARGSFSELLKQGQAPYVMFADQDDVWLPNKIELCLDHMCYLEKRYGDHIPLLVHTDLKVVKADLSVLSESFWRYTQLNPHITHLNRVLTQNHVTGCTMMINRVLADLAYPIPETAIMHDWWMALIAAGLGKISPLHQPTLLYRQHGTNTIGAKKYGMKSFLQGTALEMKKQQSCVQQTYRQAQTFLHRYNHLLNAKQKQLVQAYVELKDLSYFPQKKQILKYKFFKHGYLRNIKIFI